MGSTHRFLALNDDLKRVLDWFAALKDAPQVVSVRDSRMLYFAEVGSLALADGGEVDLRRSPVASLYAPERRRGVLWTAGELHFLATPLAKLCPRLNTISRGFSKWLGEFECVFARSVKSGEWDYYLEGSL